MLMDSSLRGRPNKLSLQVRMAIRRRVQEWKGRKRQIYDALAAEHSVAAVTIRRIYNGHL
jgi:hypothetical protein